MSEQQEPQESGTDFAGEHPDHDPVPEQPAPPEPQPEPEPEPQPEPAPAPTEGGRDIASEIRKYGDGPL